MFSTQYIRWCVIFNWNRVKLHAVVVKWKYIPKLSGFKNIRKQPCFEHSDDVFVCLKIGFWERFIKPLTYMGAQLNNTEDLSKLCTTTLPGCHPSPQTNRKNAANNQLSFDTCPQSCTLAGWLSRGHLRTTTSDRGGESMPCLSTSLLIKEPLFTSGSAYDKESSQLHIFSLRRVVSLLLKALPSSKFASQKRSARGQSLDRGSPVRGKSNGSLFDGRARGQEGPLTYKSLIYITPLQFRKEAR